jgi:hypothetical protein
MDISTSRSPLSVHVRDPHLRRGGRGAELIQMAAMAIGSGITAKARGRNASSGSPSTNTTRSVRCQAASKRWRGMSAARMDPRAGGAEEPGEICEVRADLARSAEPVDRAPPSPQVIREPSQSIVRHWTKVH